MKNNFNLEVSFSEVPLYPYEWSKTSLLMHIKVMRVPSNILRRALSHQGKIFVEDATLLLSDTKNAVVLRLDREGNIKARSFLKFSDALDVCEYACNLREIKLKTEFYPEKVKYDRELAIENEVKKFLIDKISQCQDEDFSKYLYYLYFDDVKDFSVDKLIKSISSNSIDKNMKLYKFLIES